MIPKKYSIMLTCILVLPSYSADNPSWLQRMKPYMAHILGLSTGGVTGAVFAPRLQQNRYFGALCGATLGLSSAYLLNWLYKKYSDRNTGVIPVKELGSKLPRFKEAKRSQSIPSDSDQAKQLSIISHKIMTLDKDAAIASFKKANIPPDTFFDSNNNTALHIALRHKRYDFAVWFVTTYSSDIDRILLLTNKSNVSPLYIATENFIGNDDQYTQQYSDVADLFTHDPLYQRILYIIAHKNNYPQETHQDIDSQAKKIEQKIGKQLLDQLIQQSIEAQQGSSSQGASSSSSSVQTPDIVSEEPKEQPSAQSEPEQKQHTSPEQVNTPLQQPAAQISQTAPTLQSCLSAQPTPITQADADAHKEEMRTAIVRKRPEAITMFQEYNYAPDTLFNGDTALHIAIRNYYSEFVYLFIDQYKDKIDNILMLKNDKKLSCLLSAITHLKA